MRIVELSLHLLPPLTISYALSLIQISIQRIMLRLGIRALPKRLYSTEVSSPSYIITRTDASGSLPVYLDIKNGGTRSLTIIRRVQGDAEALRQEVASLFPDTPKNFVTVNPINNQVVIKGSYVNDIKQWLAQKGF